MKLRFYLFFVLLLILSCNQKQQHETNSAEVNDSLKNTSESIEFEIWQLDYYPDSLLANRSINDNSGWESAYAYNIQLSKSYDSCQFIGWHESWWNRLIKIDERNYQIKDMDYQYWELKFKSDDRILMRHIYNKSSNRQKEDTGIFVPYHKVKEVLTLDSLDKLVANRIFAGSYKVLFFDTLSCESIITLDKNFGVTGIRGISKYCFETAIDWDFPVNNAFGFYKKKDHPNTGLSFKFIGDTLLIKDYKILHDEGGDFSGTEISRTRIKMIKIN